MTDKAAIRELREKVEAGGDVDDFIGRFLAFTECDAWRKGRDLVGLAVKSYDGSLDAALALHEAVLPGWGYCIDAENSDPSVCVYGSDLDQVGIGKSKSPARAWLLAVLRATEAEND